MKLVRRIILHICWRLNEIGVFHTWNDEKYLKFIYPLYVGKSLNLESPSTFNEKLQWLKIYDRQPLYTTMVDKYEVKQYVENLIGKEYVIQTLGVWDSFEEIDFDTLPDQFVLKCTHDSGGLVVCRDKRKLDMKTAKRKINRSLKRNYYWAVREWPYKNVKPRIIAEEYMQDGNNEVLNVYKIFNFHGVPKIIQAIQNDKTANETIDYFDANWNLLNMKQNYPNSEIPLERPGALDDMLKLAQKLSLNMPFLRTDFYMVNGHIFFSEFTFYSDGGIAVFKPEGWDNTLGEWIKLPKKTKQEDESYEKY